ncbi:hypothetical protein Vadar_024635 [Vaccinium darrowii]|uniref:Uncharacterized protein n=1 Tax=Vaccinium darrowii TaxID=229202 RepID=A0ACB7Y1Z3_9ERIC|nr:hypothetical protein Vadar_024635 [Vaccinium darrowii]
MQSLLLEILADEATKENKPSNTFRPGSFARVAKEITQKYGVECQSKHVENRLKTIKSTWKIMSDLRSRERLSYHYQTKRERDDADNRSDGDEQRRRREGQRPTTRRPEEHTTMTRPESKDLTALLLLIELRRWRGASLRRQVGAEYS